jgi:hypothetical protein
MGEKVDSPVRTAAKKMAENKRKKMAMLEEIGKTDNPIDHTIETMERENDPYYDVFED